MLHYLLQLHLHLVLGIEVVLSLLGGLEKAPLPRKGALFSPGGSRHTNFGIWNIRRF